MKNLFFLILIFVCFCCKAQVIDAHSRDTDYGSVNGAYYKDIHGFRNQFVGTWMFQNEASTLTLIFQKRDYLTHNNGNTTYFEDLLVGEYSYVENGMEKINTLSNVNSNYGNSYYANRDYHHVTGSISVSSSWNPKCEDCQIYERRMLMALSEPNYDGMGIASNSFVVRHFVENGVEKLKVWFVNENQMYVVDDAGNSISPAPYKLPFGEYILTKQN